MKKEQLTEWGIAEEAADKVLAMVQKEAEKQRQGQESAKAETESLKKQLQEANQKIEEFKGMDIEGIRKVAEEYKSMFEETEKKAKADLEALQFDHALSDALQGAKARNAKAVKALLDMEGLKYANGEVVGLKDQLEKLKADNGYLFEDSKPVPQVMASVGNHPMTAGVTKEAFQKNGIFGKSRVKSEKPRSIYTIEGGIKNGR